VIRNLRQAAGDVPVVICALTVAELGHGIYHTSTEAKAQHRRRFLDELKQHVPIHPITGITAEIIARVGGEQALKGITVPFADLIIGCCALELEYAVATHNIRHFRLIPGLDVRQF
jgi:predicted nucleic acid-binding protein